MFCVRSFRFAGLLPVFVLLCCFPLRAAVVYVNKNAAGPVHDGKAWGSAFLAVQDGITAAKIGDEVWVAASMPAAPAYFEILVMSSGVAVYGGFAGTETARSQRDWTAHVTIIDAEQGGAVVEVMSDVTQAATLDGFTIRNGHDLPIPLAHGAGVYFGGGVAQLSNNIIAANAGVGVGGNGTMTLTSNTIAANTGVGVWAGGSATVANNVISGNFGSGVVAAGSDVTLNGNSISGNYGYGVQVGGKTNIFNNEIVGNSSYGIMVESGFALIVNCTVCANSLDGVQFMDYGDFFVGYGSIFNTILAFNGGHGFSASTRSVGALSHNATFGNGDGDYGNPLTVPGPGSISADPMLSNVFHDGHLQPGSPCIDAGDDSKSTGTTDLYGRPRKQGAHVDIGADESVGTTWVVPLRALHVSPTGSDSADGLTWGTAKRSVAGALSIARGPDEVWVSRGSYAESISIPAGVGLYGGFAGTETSRAGRTATGGVSVLDGGGGSKDVVSLGFNSTALDGFMIRGGQNGIISLNGFHSVSNCAITGNSAAGVHAVAGRLTLTNGTIVGNAGDGISIEMNVRLKVANTVAAFNSGRGVYSNYGQLDVFSHNDAFGNKLGDYSSFTPPLGEDNISVDPLFLNRSGGDFHLQAGSPCVDAGNDSLVSLGQADLDGRPRILGAHVDMGAYETAGSGFYVLSDAALALGVAAGVRTVDQTGFARLNVCASGQSANAIDILDALRIARKAVGLDINP